MPYGKTDIKHQGYNTAKNVLAENHETLVKIAVALLECEVPLGN